MAESESTEELDGEALQKGWAAKGEARPELHTQIDWAARTDIGRARENNEDKFDFFLPGEPTRLALRGRLWAVADGMGRPPCLPHGRAMFARSCPTSPTKNPVQVEGPKPPPSPTESARPEAAKYDRPALK